ncbi:XRE family transcriptional regulator [Micromonospora musae]|uniref:XRE family transcriptional regulator n=1 Tax=Micromonospora musae TaxID=1894970 RepID=A0A3A9Y4C7_9ACTN|nr:helix-turn-helix transcriptional regulator [Micromonospora musae]RKN20870.1 XRE family transcriptional regulator [Micromonospora musae]RKN32315.1 XRE family transcriptional regulator [Micromonospora musae]
MRESAIRPNAALGDFLRSRRARLDPTEAGVVSARRRRVPGLRREELAALAGMSVDYYTRLEQGRHSAASPGVLDAIARALHLPEADRKYLHRLAEPAPPQGDPVPVRPETRALMRALGPTPAVLINASMDVLAMNPAGRRLYAGFDAMPPHERNSIRYMLTAPGARELHGEDWTAITAEMIGILRLRTGRKPLVGGARGLVDDMTASSDLFRRVWQDQTVSLADRRRKIFHHPQAGRIELAVESLMVQHAEGQILIVLSPEPGSAAERAWHEVMARDPM